MFARLIGRKGVFDNAKLREDARGPKTAGLVILTIVGSLCAGFWLATATSVPEVTRAGGELRPLGGYQKIQSGEGGIVFDVHVVEGQVVQRDMVLASLRSPKLEESLRNTTEDWRAVNVELKNHNAFLTALAEEEASVPTWLETMRNEGLMYAASRLAVFEAQQSVQAATMEELELIIDVQERASLLTAKRATARAAQVARAEKLQAKGLITLNSLDVQRDGLDQLQASQVDVDVRLSQSRKELSAIVAQIEQNRLDFQTDLIAELFELEQKRDALSVQKAALTERTLALEIRATSQGIIQGVAFPNPGEVIAAGETLFELMPTDAKLVAEIEFDPVDIGHVSEGDPVTLKLDTYDARRYGTVMGQIVSISPNLVSDPDTNREFFRATVALEKSLIGKGPWTRPLRTGMRVTAEIVTSERTAIAYLMKPVGRSLEHAFGER